MGRRPLGEATAWSLALVRAVNVTREAAGMTNQELIDRSRMSASYYYARLRGDLPFDTNDMEKLAAALGTHPHELSRLAASSETVDQVELLVDLDPAELSRRLQLLVSAPLADGTAFQDAGFVGSLDARGVKLTPEEWSDLLQGDGSSQVRQRVMVATADYFDVNPAYLLDLADGVTADAVEAEVEFRTALRESGADSVSARAVGDVSPAALRAIAASLRSIRRD